MLSKSSFRCGVCAFAPREKHDAKTTAKREEIFIICLVKAILIFPISTQTFDVGVFPTPSAPFSAFYGFLTPTRYFRFVNYGIVVLAPSFAFRGAHTNVISGVAGKILPENFNRLSAGFGGFVEIDVSRIIKDKPIIVKDKHECYSEKTAQKNRQTRIKNPFPNFQRGTATLWSSSLTTSTPVAPL